MSKKWHLVPKKCEMYFIHINLKSVCCKYAATVWYDIREWHLITHDHFSGNIWTWRFILDTNSQKINIAEVKLEGL